MPLNSYWVQLGLNVRDRAQGCVEVDLIKISGRNLGFRRFKTAVDVELVAAYPARVSEAIHLVENVPSLLIQPGGNVTIRSCRD